MQGYQFQSYNFRTVPQIAKHLQLIRSRDKKVYDAELYELSLAREPCGADKVI